MRAPLLAVALLAAVPALADVVVLRDGGEVEGEVEELGERVRIRTGIGSVTLDRSEVREIRRQPLPRQALAARRAALAQGDVPGRLALAQFGFDHGLYAEYGALLEEALELDPDNTLAQEKHYQYRKLLEPLPRSRSIENKLRFELGDGFQLMYGDHFLVCHADQGDFAAGRLRLLEDHYRLFYRYFEERGFDLQLLDRRLEVVIFRDQEAYEAFARKHAPGFESGAGYYSSATGRLYFFDARNSRRRLEAQAELDRQEGALRALRAELQQAREARNGKRAEALYARYDEAWEAYARAKWDWRNFFDQANVATTLHEATHQLCHRSGLLRGHAGHPTWLVEGLALFFEDPEQWTTAGSRVNAIDRDRIEDLQEALRRDRLISLPALLGRATSFFTLGERRVHLAYAESWALVRYLLKGPVPEHRTRFFKYLRRQGMIRPDEQRNEARRVGEFVEAFDQDLGTFERGWREFVRAIPLPDRG